MIWKIYLQFILIIICIKNAYEIEKEKNKLSIIIPVYNTGKYLRQCLDSVINQTYHNLEIICINDGSIDNSLNILKEYGQTDNRIKIYSQTNKGVSSARNKGIELSTGDYITFVDSDDYLDLNVYEKTMEIIIENNADIVNYNIIEEEINGVEQRIYDLPYKIFINDSFNAMQGHGILPAVWVKIFKKKLLIDNNIIFSEDLDFGEDDLFRLEAFSVSQKIITIPNVYYHYRYRYNSLSKNVTDEKCLINNIKRFKYLIKFFYDHKFFEHNSYLINFSLTITIRHLIYLDKKSKKCYYAQQILNELNDIISKNQRNLTSENRKDIKKLKKLCKKNVKFHNITFILIFMLSFTVMIHRIRKKKI